MKKIVLKITGSNEKNYEAINFIFALIFCLVLPFNNRYITYLIGPWSVLSAGLAIVYRIRFIEIMKSGIFFLVFLAVSAITLFYSKNVRYGIGCLETMASLAIMPFLVLILIKTVPATSLEYLARSYIYGLLAYVAFSFITLFIRWDLKSITDYLATDSFPSACSYFKLSPILLKSYISMYFVWGIVLIINKMESRAGTRLQVFDTITGFILLLYILILGSRAALLTLFFISALFLWKYLKKFPRKFSVPVLSLVIFLLLLGLFKCTRVGETILIKNKNEEADKRLYEWVDAAQVFIKSPLFGHGIGDGLDLLVDQHKINGHSEAVELRLNAHNQFLETAIQSGIIGLACLLIAFLIPLITAIKRKKELLYILLGIIMINFLFESMLVRLAGVLFTAFWMSLIISLPGSGPFVTGQNK